MHLIKGKLLLVSVTVKIVRYNKINKSGYFYRSGMLDLAPLPNINDTETATVING